MYLDAMREIYLMAVLNLMTTRGKCLPPTWDPVKTQFKVGDMVLLKSHSSTSAFNAKYNPVSKSVNGYLIKLLMYKIVHGKLDMYLGSIWLNMY